MGTGSTGRPTSGLSVVVNAVRDTVVHLSGEIDTYRSLELRDRLGELIDAGHRRIVLDLANVDFLDSTGIWTIARAHKRLTAHGGRLRLQAISVRLRDLFEVSGVPDSVMAEASGDQRSAAAT